jgi:DNA-binding response OmpR family regulator
VEEKLGSQDEVRVVVVDDDSDLRETMLELLELDGYRVRGASNAEDAVSVIAEHMPLAVLLDLNLPTMNGVDLARHIRATFGQELVVIVLTGSTSAADKYAAEVAGVDYVLQKPLDAGLLRRMLPVIG